jgi:hypothetical protein
VPFQGKIFMLVGVAVRIRQIAIIDNFTAKIAIPIAVRAAGTRQ